MTSALFQPFHAGPISLPNRIAMAPMTRHFAPGGVPGPANAAYYRRRVEGGVGLIITEGAWIDHAAAGNHLNVPRLFGAAALQGWKLVVDEVHRAGGKIMPQLWHLGRERRPRPAEERLYPNPDVVSVSASDSGVGDVWPCRAMTQDDIDGAVAAYAAAAVAAKTVGFDGVEIHGAHGYLVDQFLRRETNLRTDGYGGKARTRFAVEIVRAIRQQVGPDFPISFRFSQWTVRDYEAKLVETPKELEELLLPLSEAGVDIFHCSTRRYWEPLFGVSGPGLAGWTKSITGKIVIAVGSIGLDKPFLRGPSDEEIPIHGAIEDLEQRLSRGEFDLVAIGRALLANPDWPSRVQQMQTAFAPLTAQVRATLA